MSQTNTKKTKTAAAKFDQSLCQQAAAEKLEQLTNDFLAKLQAAGFFADSDTREIEQFVMRLDRLVCSLE
jgi:hypothetical protein